MPLELRPLEASLALVRSPADGLFRGAAGRTEVIAALTGIGLAAGARAATRVLDAGSPDHLIVVGVAGGIGGSVEVGDLVVPELVVNLATGAGFRPTALGGTRPRGTLASSDALLESPEEARELTQRGIVAVDMETAAIAAVCEERGCPWSVFRGISDRADDGGTDQAVLGLVGPDGRPNLAAVARFLLTKPHRIPQLVRLARGTNAATRAVAGAVSEALGSF